MKMSSNMTTQVFSSLVLLMTILSSSFLKAKCSGVFELELMRFQQSSEQTSSSLITNKITNRDPQDVVRIFVCLKEPFTNQLDGPCTFGNSSITLNRELYSAEATNSDIQESQLTNIVRILFTFRWTKSFTIILTAEEVQNDVYGQRQQQRGLQIKQKEPSETTLNGGDGTKTKKSLNQKEEPTLSSGVGIRTRREKFVDRHVLTENEVVPIFEQNSNKSWTTRYSRSALSTLEFKFRVYCSSNYYGDDCTTFCRPRDDNFGHYNCSSTGQKICLTGWEGFDCDKAKCSTGCNPQHGHCDKPNTCQCRPGWTGPRCDQCITYPGCQNGYCLSPWQCICQRNWGGVLCDQDLNYCGSHDPCKNNGTCQNVAPGKYKCHCPSGFTGVDCDMELNVAASSSYSQISAGCALNPCLNGGQCYGFNNNILRSKHEAATSNMELPTTEPDYTDGPLVSDRFYRCQCPAGWTGDYCQWSDSSLVPTSDLLLNETAEANLSLPAAKSDDLDLQTIHLEAKMETIELEKYQTVPNEQLQANHQVELKHLISGVVVATVTGVFLACLLFIWCCLIALDRNQFSVIQMNIIRGNDPESLSSPEAFSSRLRRVQEKIRDSFRRSSSSSSGRIKPETKFSIENVLRPPKPPSYEESNYHKCSLNAPPISNKCLPASHREDMESRISNEEDLVTRGAIEEKLSASANFVASTSKPKAKPVITRPNINCPRHGHLYRSKMKENPDRLKGGSEKETGSTCIEISSKSANSTHRLDRHNR